MKQISIYNIINNSAYSILFMISAVFLINYKIYTLSLEESRYINEANQYHTIENSIQKISDDLTTVARSYISTENKKYKDIYFKLFGIINGNYKFPENQYTLLTYLENNLNVNYKSISPEIENNISIILTDDSPKYSSLQNAVKQSALLSKVEMKAFHIMEMGRREEALQLLYSKDYLDHKLKISKHIYNSITQTRKDTITFINDIHYKMQNLFYLDLLIFSLIFITRITLNNRIKKTIGASIKLLENWGKELSMGNYKATMKGYVPKELYALKIIIEKLANNTSTLISQLENDAAIDELTKLPNRKVMND